ncbi:MAG: right-handed parallel beta-helix repeat-containing protein [Fibrobacteria bacterium]|nr:right-handed parallel beta-helix repeat-containing protein [Fibrobacteria bacterium]
MLQRAVAPKVGLFRWVLGAIVALVLMPTTTRAQITVTVGAGGTYSTIQQAVNACPTEGCVINLIDTTYFLSQEIWIEGKNNLTIQAAQNLQLAGKRPRIFTTFDLSMTRGTGANPTDPLRPAGWKRWPKTCKDETGGSLDTDNPFSTSGFQHNGLIVVYKSTNVTIEGLNIDGIRPMPFVNKGIWDCKYEVYFGNVGINLFQSKNVVVRNNEIKNFYSSIYMQNRNVGGAFAAPNPDDQDVKDIIPYSQYGKVGDHLIEKNLIHHNWWGIYDEMEWDIGSTIRYNILDSNANTRFKSTMDSSSDANNHVGGFMFVKDVMIVPHKIYNNTINGSAMVMGHGYFKPGVQHYFYNNLLTNWYRATPEQADQMGQERQILSWYKNFMYHNTFEIASDSGLQRQSMTSGNVNDTAACALSGQRAPCWITFDAKVDVFTGYQMNKLLWNGWEIAQGGNFTAMFNAAPYTVYNNQVVDIFGTNASGLIKSATGVGTAKRDISAQQNFWARDIPFISMKPGSAGYLEPKWGNATVDSTILDNGWDAAGNRDQDGSQVDRGAIPKSKGALVSPLTLKDQSIVKLDKTGLTVDFDYCLDGAGTWTNVRLEKVEYYNNIARATDDAPKPTPDWPVPSTLTNTGTDPEVGGCNTFSAKLPKAPVDSFARFDLIFSGDLNGQTIRSNVGVWIWRQTQYILDIYFTRPGGKDPLTTVKVGDPVDMHVRALRTDGTAQEVSPIDILTALPSRNTFLIAGDKQIVSGDTIGRAVASGTVFPIYFTESGMTTISMSGMIGKLPVPGSAGIRVRPGPPELAVWSDPPSYAAMDHSIPLDSLNPRVVPQSPTPLLIDVKDKYGNLVDTTGFVVIDTLMIDRNPTIMQFASDIAGPFAAKPWILPFPATGKMSVAVNLRGTEGTRFWGLASVQGKTAIDSGLMKVGKQLERLWFTPVAPIDTYVTVKQKVHIILSEDGILSKPTSAFATASVKLRSAKGTQFFATAASTTPLDSVSLIAGEIDLWVTSATPLVLDTLYASNFLLGQGLPATYAPVTWRMPPLPPAPIPSSASFLDFDCDGYADSIDVKLKDPAGVNDKLNDKIKIDSIHLVYGKTDVWAKSGWRVLVTDSSRVRIALPVASTTRGDLNGVLKFAYTVQRPPVPDTSYFTAIAAIADKVGPSLVDTAYLVENFGRPTTNDTLKLKFSEGVNFPAGAWSLVIVDAAGTPVPSTGLTVVSSEVSATDATRFTVVFSGNTAGNLVRQGYRLRLDPTGTAADLAGNLAAGAECAPGVPVVEIPAPVPVVKVWLKSTLGNGQADKLFVQMAKPTSRSLKPTDLPAIVHLTWGSTLDSVTVLGTGFVQSPLDSTIWEIAVGPMAFGATIGFQADGSGQVLFAGAGRAGEAYSVIDSVSPIPVKATLAYGAGSDLLTVTYSEPLVLAATSGVYMNWKTGMGAEQAVPSGNPSMLQNDPRVWVFPMPAKGATNPNPGDSTRLPLANSNLLAANGTPPSSTAASPFVLVNGGDRPPANAWYRDTNADGIVDYVGMVFVQPLKTSPSFVFKVGNETRTIDSTNGLVLNAGRNIAEVSFAALPFTAIVTGINPLDSLGSMTSTMGEVTLTSRFPVRDSVDPVILTARLNYASYVDDSQGKDTLRLVYSEPIMLPPTATNLTWGPSLADVHNLLPIGIQVVSDREVWMFFDTTAAYTQLAPGDSVRIAPIDMGGQLTDTYRNAPVGALAKWTTIYAGPRPPRFKVDIYPSPVMRVDPTKLDVAGLGISEQITVWVSSKRFPDTALMKMNATGQLLGTVVTNTTVDGFGIGPKFSVNGPLEATALIYDNMGVYVGSKQITIDSAAIANGNFAAKDGSFEVALLWNGKNSLGNTVGSGIYMFRVVVYRDLVDPITLEKARRLAMNQVTKVGVFVPTK